MLRDLETFCLKLFCLLISHIADLLGFHGERNSLMSTVTTEEATFVNVGEGGGKDSTEKQHTLPVPTFPLPEEVQWCPAPHREALQIFPKQF